MQLIQGFMAVFHPVTLSLIIGGVVAVIVFGAIPGLSAFTALALSAILLGESLTFLQWIGAACILGGVALSELWHPGKKG